MSKISKETINKIFGIGAVSEIPEGLRILHEATAVDGTRDRILRDADGRYYLMAEPAEAGKPSYLGMAVYSIDRQVIMPVSRESALFWSERNLCGDEMSVAMEEFGEHVSSHHLVWEYREKTHADRTDINEWLMVSETGDFTLYSTDDSYPFCDDSTNFVRLAENGTEEFAGDIYVYCIPAETACRWAEARGMDTEAYAEIFGQSEA